MSKKNLLDETIKIIDSYGYTDRDVVCVIDEKTGVKNTWEYFVEKSENFMYDNGYGGEEVNTELCIVGKDWWISRRSYDGSEWWHFNKQPDPNHYVMGDINIEQKYWWDEDDS